MKRGKAVAVDNLTLEHIIFGHPSLIYHLCRLFNLMMMHSYVPCEFGRGITSGIQAVPDTVELQCLPGKSVPKESHRLMRTNHRPAPHYPPEGHLLRCQTVMGYDTAGLAIASL